MKNETQMVILRKNNDAFGILVFMTLPGATHVNMLARADGIPPRERVLEAAVAEAMIAGLLENGWHLAGPDAPKPIKKPRRATKKTEPTDGYAAMRMRDGG